MTHITISIISLNCHICPYLYFEKQFYLPKTNNSTIVPSNNQHISCHRLSITDQYVTSVDLRIHHFCFIAAVNKTKKIPTY